MEGMIRIPARPREHTSSIVVLLASCDSEVGESSMVVYACSVSKRNNTEGALLRRKKAPNVDRGYTGLVQNRPPVPFVAPFSFGG